MSRDPSRAQGPVVLHVLDFGRRSKVEFRVQGSLT